MGLAVHARHPERAVLPEKPQWRDAREAGCLECRQARRHVEREQRGGFLRGHRAPERTSVVPSAEPLIHITNDTSVGGHSGALAQPTIRVCDAPAMEGDLSFLGGATLYRDRQKIEVHAELFGSSDSDGSQHWWGTLSVLGEDEPPLAPGNAYLRFSDGTDAQVALRTSDGQEASFEVIKLGTL